MRVGSSFLLFRSLPFDESFFFARLVVFVRGVRGERHFDNFVSMSIRWGGLNDDRGISL